MDPAELAQCILNLTQRMEDLTLNVTEIRNENRDLREKMLLRPPEGASAHLVQSHPAPEPQVSPPDTFSGDRKTYSDFLLLMFELRPRSYPTDHVKVRTLISYLRGEARAWANTYLETNDPLLESYDGFIAAMSQLYEDPGKQITAETAIRNIRQGKRPVEDFIAEFKRWARQTERISALGTNSVWGFPRRSKMN
ncbi:PREDICTED: protein LDOC1L-like [Nanorana parkeri]|uniref:protein LDOC1L-like n=1 Tax=Nanorana parkeri TaxID=125878 RepID=UPI0008549AEB|nr:PREDICTED: protein LDOC1L-like [Nanorana parkeri]